MQSVEQIAAGLTDAQRRLLRNHPFWGLSIYSTVKAVRSRGLLEGSKLTPLGLAVRDHIKGTENG